MSACAQGKHVNDTQADIDVLLDEAQGLASQALVDGGDPSFAAPQHPCDSDAARLDDAAGPRPAASVTPVAPSAVPSTRIERILGIRVPVIVKLAERKMPLSNIVGLAAGAILEFDKPSDSPLDLMINNKSIGLGQAVKVGENFGLRVTHIGSVRNRIEALSTR